MLSVSELFGNIDIYLFDQIQRGRVPAGMTVLDAGCGAGRNLVYFLRTGYAVLGVDRDAEAVAAVRRLARALSPATPETNFRLGELGRMSFGDAVADFVISSAVLHFARDDAHFETMLADTWRVLKPGGIFFCRLASSTGMEDQVSRVSGRRFLLPDGSERYLVDEELLMRHTAAMKAELLDPLKTTIVQNQRCMTTWVLRKPGAV